ncbi:MAG TPA: hypothetical protein VMZ22_12030 [Acidimicrobiales bacterium]|nr:hypothetical protein [Acidimicrobiales bacterium]
MTASVNNKLSYELAKTMQRLWADHAMWMRQYMVAAVDERPEAAEAAARLLRNADDIGNTFEDYYSRRVARRVAKLLRQHAVVAIDLVDAARRVDRAKFANIDAVWTSNGEDLVDELCARNESWSNQELLTAWESVRQFTKNELTARLEQNFDRDVEAFDHVLSATMDFGDHITDGILRQFADEFAA